MPRLFKLIKLITLAALSAMSALGTPPAAAMPVFGVHLSVRHSFQAPPPSSAMLHLMFSPSCRVIIQTIKPLQYAKYSLAVSLRSGAKTRCARKRSVTPYPFNLLL